MGFTNKENVMGHLKNDQKFPATREELLEECNHLSDFTKDDKEWFMKSLPDGTYNSAEEVMAAIGIQQPAAY